MDTLAFDLGASSGRALLGKFHNEKLVVKEVYRFSNDPVSINEKTYWDILRLLYEIKKGLTFAVKNNNLKSIAIDTWGLDFGLLGKNDELLGNPTHYRNRQADGMIDEVTKIIPKEEIYSRTGTQFSQVNSIYHLFAMQKEGNPVYENAKAFLMIADLIRFFLTGEKTSEETIVSTSQLYNPTINDWDHEVIRKLGFPKDLFPELISPGTYSGSLRPSISKKLGVPALEVIAVGEHDTASAIVAIPAESKDFAYLSCGTWSLLGTEVDQPIINEQSLKWNFTNERGVFGTFRLLKNIMGLWILQQCKRVWEIEEGEITYEKIVTMASNAKPFKSFIDPDDDMFLNPDHMPDQIKKYCALSNQPIPETRGEIARIVIESLALKYKFYFQKVEKLVSKNFDRLHIVGGGVNNGLLCQFTANAIGKPVWAGPSEAASIGNILMQYAARGELRNLKEARDIVKQSFKIQIYEPKDINAWSEIYESYCDLLFVEK